MTPRTSRGRAGHDYPPLAFAALVMLLLLGLMPSALNLPQTNPSQTLEYAPVPPENQQAMPPAGNFSSLGLGGSSSLREGPGTAPDLPPIETGGRGIKAASTKRCVGNPARQTEDPLSPPCVASFTGDNGGSTYAGVTKDEVVIIFYLGGWCGYPPGARNPGPGTGSSRESEKVPCGEYHDLAEPPPADGDEYIRSRMLRSYQRYFNERYQTYGRFIHFIAYYSGGYTDEVHRAEATEHIRKYNPFAVVNFIAGSEAYLEVITSKRIMHFTGSGSQAIGGVEEKFYDKAPGFVWGYDPTLDSRAAAMVSWVCSQVVQFPVSFSGNAETNGLPRKLGLLHYSGPVYPQLHVYARLVKAGVERCGGVFVAERTFDVYCEGYSVCDPAQSRGAENMAEFRQKGVTTIIWPGGEEAGQGKAAARLRYFPEIILGGDGYNDLTLEAQFQDQEFWKQAWSMTAYVLKNPFTGTPCYQAAKEADPEAPATDIRNYGCKDYDAVRQLVTGIQVAGPRLTPQSMEKGFRAIPEVRSEDPRVPACFYPDGGYTCVQDFAINWYDPTGDDPESTNPGCNRMLQGGARRLPNGFPREDVPTRRDVANDPCNPTGLTV